MELTLATQREGLSVVVFDQEVSEHLVERWRSLLVVHQIILNQLRGVLNLGARGSAPKPASGLELELERDHEKVDILHKDYRALWDQHQSLINLVNQE